MNKGSDRRNGEVAPPPPEDGEDDLPLVLEEWDGGMGGPKVLARLETLALALATFESALAEAPDRKLVLRQGDRVVRSSMAL